MRKFIVSFTFILALALGTLVSLSLPGCSSPPRPHTPATSAQLASVVVLVEQVAVWREPSLSDKDFGVHTGMYVPAWRGSCNAFAMTRDSGELYLVTAAHCTPRVLGAVLRYLPPDGWGVDRARLVKVDRQRDYAELQPERSGGLVSLERGPAPEVGEPVLSVSAYFEEQAQGTSTGALSGGWYGTTQHVQHGWSGSPVLDSAGRAWGFLAKCQTTQGKCADGAIAGAL